MTTNPIHPASGRAARNRCRKLLFVAASLSLSLASASSPATAQNLLANGTFDDSEGPLKGWITDYEWSGNKHYVGNKERVSVVDSVEGKSTVASFVPAGDAGAKMESLPIPFGPGFRYKATLDVKGGPYRIYFAGYKWEPGIRPHEAPELGELRLVYKSKASSGEASASWEKVELELPGVELSAQAKAHLKNVRFVTLYIWFMKPGHIDNVALEKVADPAVTF